MISSTKKIPSKALYAILAVALLLRVAGVWFGLPALYHQDEPMMVNHAMAIGATGDWNTHYFVIPPFVSYLLFMLYGAYFLIGRLFSIFPTANDFAIHFFRDPAMFYLIGRLAVGVAFGVSTVWLIAQLGGRFFSAKTGLWAALFLALSLVHVQYSHYIYADSPVTFAMTLLCFWHLKLLKEPTPRNFILMGLILGWAVSIKYTALYFLPTTLLCYGLIYGQKSFTVRALQNILAAGVVSIVVFALLAPYTFLDWPGFYTTFLRQSGSQGYVGIGHYLRYSLLSGTSIFLMLLSGAGLVLSFRSHPKETQVIAFFAVTFYLINTWAGQPFSRYVLPIVPILCLWGGAGMDRVCGLLERRRWLIYVSGSVVILSLFVPTAYGDWLYIQKDTRTQCAEWFKDHVKEGSVVVMDSRFYGPHIQQSESQLEDKMAYLLKSGPSAVKAKRLELEKLAIKDKNTYNIYTLWQGEGDEAPGFLIQWPFVRPEKKELQKIGAEYLVLNYIGEVPAFHDLKEALKGQAHLTATFSPYRSSDIKRPLDPHSSTAAPHLPAELFMRNRLGPYLEVYKIEDMEAGQR